MRSGIQSVCEDKSIRFQRIHKLRKCASTLSPVHAAQMAFVEEDNASGP